MPKVRWRYGSREGGSLGRIHNLDQEKAAPREVVEDHGDEGPVEMDGERLRRHVSGDCSGGGCHHSLLIELQHGFMDHLWGRTKAGGQAPAVCWERPTPSGVGSSQPQF